MTAARSIIAAALLFLFAGAGASAQSAGRCPNPQNYGLSPEEAAGANRELYCWEIRYLKEFKDGRTSMGTGEYLSLYSNLAAAGDIGRLRTAGITPEKALYLQRHFTDDETRPLNFATLGPALSKAAFYMRQQKVEYKVGKTLLNPVAGTAYYNFLFFPVGCLKKMEMRRFEAYPEALRPVGVIGQSFINAFGEVVGTIGSDELADAILASEVEIPQFGMPIEGEIRITSMYGGRDDPLEQRTGIDIHTGVDFGAPEGTPVIATAPGVVSSAGSRGNYGLSVEVSHGNGFATRYSHLSRILVKAGDEVATGTRLGLVGSTGRSTGPHLDYELRHNGVPINPYPSMSGQIYPFYVLGETESAGYWDEGSCKIYDIGREIKRKMACTSCTIFEIAFNTISRVGFVMYDKLARYATMFMAVIFLLWTLYQFVENIVKKNESFEFVKTFFNKSMVLFIAACALSVSITDENNMMNYSIRPLTDFMREYNEVMTAMIDKTNGGRPVRTGREDSLASNLKDLKELRDQADDGRKWKCKYATRDIADNKVLFSREVKKNIVCTIERIADFNNMNMLIGWYQARQGARQVFGWGMDITGGLAKIVVGLAIAAMFFYMNLTIPFYFIESIFMIGIVVFLLPLFLAAAPLEKSPLSSGLIRKGIDTFLSAVFQIVSLTLMCSVISMLMMFVSGLDFFDLTAAMNDENSQKATSQILYILSFNMNDLLQVLYTGVVCFYLMGESVKIANKFQGITNETFGGNAPKKFLGWTMNVIKHSTSVVRDKVAMRANAKVLSDRLTRERRETAADRAAVRKTAQEKADSEAP